MEHLRHGCSIVSEGISSHVAFPLRRPANDDVNAQAKALSDRLFEQPAHFVSRDISIDNQIAALDIRFRTLQTDLDGQRAQVGHRQFAR